jgi:hypothetical protein
MMVPCMAATSHGSPFHFILPTPSAPKKNNNNNTTIGPN